MLFNSIDFLLFLPAVFLVYWLIKDHIKFRNIFLLGASYLFYGWWDWRFLILIFASSCCDYLIGLSMGQTENIRKRKILLTASLVVNLGLLAFFKYFNFFIDSWNDAFGMFGLDMSISSLKIILPVGISFYTFQTLSYTIDIYRKQLEPTRDAIAFFAFVSFFPQLVAGPIERAKNLLPQFSEVRSVSGTKVVSGLYQILWGFFKKMVIADNCAPHVNEIFDNYQEMPPSMLLLGAFYFAFQIYGDFSGYSDIAIGTARLFGFDLMKNFNYPYFSRDIAEFWRRWHISLSTWFRDYLYIPLGGSRVSKLLNIRNVLIVFTVSGFWHGANWTFLFWGLLNGLYFLPLLIRGKNRQNLDVVAAESIFPSFREIFQILLTFFITIVAWVFFRADSIGQAFDYLGNWISPEIIQFSGDRIEYVPLILLMLFLEYISRHKDHPLVFEQPFAIRNVALAMVLFWMILIWGNTGEVEFIYFQF